MDFSKTKKKKKKKKDIDDLVAEDEKEKAEEKENGNYIIFAITSGNNGACYPSFCLNIWHLVSIQLNIPQFLEIMFLIIILS